MVLACTLSLVQLFATLWIVALQAPLSTGPPLLKYSMCCHLIESLLASQGLEQSLAYSTASVNMDECMNMRKASD